MTGWTVERRDARQGPPRGLVADLIWTDPPFGTGKRQRNGTASYADRCGDHIPATIATWAQCLRPNGVLAVCMDYRLHHHVVSHLVGVGMDYHGDIVWSFGLGRPRTDWWPVRHNTVSTFTWPGGRPRFDAATVPREPRKAPRAGYPTDKPAGSVWDYTMSNTAPERVAYPNQKPTAIIHPFVLAHTQPGDMVADPFSGSGSTGVAAVGLGRSFYGCDTNPAAVAVSASRLCPPP